MAKGYWIGHVTVTDPDRYPDYVAANTPVFEAWGATFHVRGGEFEVPEGSTRNRHVVIEFESYEKALACYHSPEYQAAAKLRHASSDADIIVVKGVE